MVLYFIGGLITAFLTTLVTTRSLADGYIHLVTDVEDAAIVSVMAFLCWPVVILFIVSYIFTKLMMRIWKETDQ